MKSPEKVIPADFDGFSIEVDGAANRYLGPASSPNLVFYQLMKNLGKATIRIGGDSADYSCWDPSAAPHPAGCKYTITRDDLRGYLKASAATGWGLIMDINLAQNSARWALRYGIALVKARAAYPGSRLTGFEFGNEPNLYSSENILGNAVADHESSIRPASYSWQDLVREWKPYIAAFKSDARTQSVPLMGPAYDTGNTWVALYLGSFLEEVGPRNVSVVTVHEYPTGTCPGDNAKAVTIRHMLAQNPLNSYISTVVMDRWVSTTSRRGLPLQLDETNFTGCSDRAGVNDVFAVTLWGLDWLFTNFNLGFRRVNFYMYNDDYSVVHAVARHHPHGALSYVTTAEPLYYAMYTFNQNAEGNSILPTSVSAKANIKAYAVESSSTGAVTVFVLNKDLNASGTVSVKPSERMGAGSLVLVQAPALNSKSVTYGGESFNGAGRLSGSPHVIPIHATRGNYSFYLPRASIALLRLDPRSGR